MKTPFRTALTRAALLVASLSLAAACAEPGDTQSLDGTLRVSSFKTPPVGVRAVQGGAVIAEGTVARDGSFHLDVPRGTDYRLEVVTAGGVHPFVREGRAIHFDVCQPGAGYDLGDVRFHEGGDGSAGGGNTDPGTPGDPGDGDCGDPPPPCDPTFPDGNCEPCAPDGTCPPPPPPCDPGDPNCGDPWPCDPGDPNCDPCLIDPSLCDPPPPCDPSTDPYCDCDAAGNCPPPCDPATDPNCGDPWPCDPGDPNCDPCLIDPSLCDPWPCDPATDPYCDCAADGTCPPPPCDPADPNCDDPCLLDPTFCDPCILDPSLCDPCDPATGNCWPEPPPCDENMDPDDCWWEDPTCDFDDPACWPDPIPPCADGNLDPEGCMDEGNPGDGCELPEPLPAFGCE